MNILQFILFFALSIPFVVLPRRAASLAGAALGLIVHRAWGSRRRIALENLRAAVARGAITPASTPEETIRRNFMNMGRYLSDVVRVFWGLGDPIVNGIRVEGLENYLRAKQEGRGVIFVGGHCGNWELLALSISTKAGRVSGVARRLDNPYLESFVLRARQRYGTSILYKQGALKGFVSVLREGGSVGVLIDQAVLPEEGVLVDFLGAPAWTTKLPAALARRTGARLVPSFIRRAGEGYEIRLHPAVEMEGDDAGDMKRLTAYVEDFIRENPSEWLWMHRRWKRAPVAPGTA